MIYIIIFRLPRKTGGFILPIISLSPRIVKKLKCFCNIWIIGYSVSHKSTNQQMVNPDQAFVREIRRFDADVRDWNSRPDVQAQLHHRSRIINNTNNYHTGDRHHQLRSIQVVEQGVWDLLFGGQFGQYLHADALAYSERIIRDITQSHYCLEQLEVSLLLNENVEDGGIHQAIFFIHVTPHRAMQYGHMVCYDVAEGDEQYEIIEDIFRLGDDPNAIVGSCCELDMLELLADENEMQELLHYVFLPEVVAGVHSRRFIVEDRADFPDHSISGLNRRLLELENHPVIVNDGDEEEEEEEEEEVPANPAIVVANGAGGLLFEQYNNIIGYWLENDNRVNEYINIVQGRQNGYYENG